MIEPKERFRRLKVRLKTLFDIPDYFEIKHNGRHLWFSIPKSNKKFSQTRIPVRIPNYYYTPFEVYLLAHLQRAHFIMTCNEWAYVDASNQIYNKYFATSEKYRRKIYEWQTEQMEKRLNEFAERVKTKDEIKNTQTESDN